MRHYLKKESSSDHKNNAIDLVRLSRILFCNEFFCNKFFKTKKKKRKKNSSWEVVADTFNPSSGVAEAGGSWAFQGSQGYRETLQRKTNIYLFCNIYITKAKLAISNSEQKIMHQFL